MVRQAALAFLFVSIAVVPRLSSLPVLPGFEKYRIAEL